MVSPFWTASRKVIWHGDSNVGGVGGGVNGVLGLEDDDGVDEDDDEEGEEEGDEELTLGDGRDKGVLMHDDIGDDKADGDGEDIDDDGDETEYNGCNNEDEDEEEDEDEDVAGAGWGDKSEADEGVEGDGASVTSANVVFHSTTLSFIVLLPKAVTRMNFYFWVVH